MRLLIVDYQQISQYSYH